MTAVVLRGDARRLPLPDACVDLIVTSPPYFGLRSYTDGGGHYDGQIGSEATPGEWVAALVACTAEWVRVLKPSGSIFVNLGDKYSGGTSGEQSGLRPQPGADVAAGCSRTASSVGRWLRAGCRPKSLLGLPWRYALACMDELGLILRRDIIWSKPNGLPESVTDRCRSSHEYLFHFTVRPRYYAAVDEIREPHAGQASHGRAAQRRRCDGSIRRHGDRRQAHSASDPASYNPLGKLPGSVWEIPSQPLSVPAHLGVDHFAAFPMELPRRVILGWSPPGVCTACGEGRRPVADAEHVDTPGGSTAGTNRARANGIRTSQVRKMARGSAVVLHHRVCVRLPGRHRAGPSRCRGRPVCRDRYDDARGQRARPDRHRR